MSLLKGRFGFRLCLTLLVVGVVCRSVETRQGAEVFKRSKRDAGDALELIGRRGGGGGGGPRGPGGRPGGSGGGGNPGGNSRPGNQGGGWGGYPGGNQGAGGLGGQGGNGNQGGQPSSGSRPGQGGNQNPGGSTRGGNQGGNGNSGGTPGASGYYRWIESGCSVTCGQGINVRRQFYCTYLGACTALRTLRTRCFVNCYQPPYPAIPTPAPGPVDPPTNTPAPTGNCGRQMLGGSSFQNIIGGTEATLGEFPWMAQVLDQDSQIFCGGSIIGNKWILTAAHCVQGSGYTRTPEQVNVRVGTNMLQGGTLHRVQRIHVYPGFQESELPNDIALLELDSILDLNNGIINSVCLPRANTPDGMTCTATGYGATSTAGTGVSNVLRKVSLRVRSDSTCSYYYRQAFNQAAMICAGTSPRTSGTFRGDSGGPLNCPAGDRYYVVGVTSFSDSARNAPDVYADVVNFVPWIETIMSAY